VVFHNQVRYCSGLAHLGDGCFLGLQFWKAIGNFLLPLRKEREEGKPGNCPLEWDPQYAGLES
jgi:hypothetical protein